MTTVDIVGYNVFSSPKSKLAEELGVCLRSEERQCKWLACLNPHSYTVARGDTGFGQALQAAQWLVPDGVGVVIASKLVRGTINERITGFDVFESVMSDLERLGGSVFFLGSTEHTISLIGEKLALDYPNVRLAGAYSPPFKPEFSPQDNAEIISAVAASGADVLWVGMTAPKQEKWIAEHRDQLPVKFAGAIGAVFDFYTGQVKRSPMIFQKLGLEWLPRLAQQPRRLWKRMFVSAPVFIFDVLLSAFRRQP
ncbi:N-acetylglucosaminyldiphosphoundecaprenol N-acetyl-beta-D-mannosaminyltransferase [Rhodovulum sulfidophilum]|uniref:WecB/TagA/CpsF family glycosyltransferase n=1 Tax=Rhodovulum sulfidophilum TaxID=35806 RepID=UPI0005A73889|nr:WecB/TagA/CpsF family glycosyltransferase [Rhodovulum sulfidophilum]ANB34413.1 N-acetylglucosaminyldiphospho-UDP N-acetyl-beta-D-mannosaminyltransferase [Rhodovulum sulfidophilum DSM 1374]ANB38236.1 N-acetylglucosaminyldiphospho-UDP N-acetyl-beta-D-mannosaminyltransferase [Rhodovulum sulfidophilum]MCW2305465.1 N-acetylglucosaminyldiphosphoundecaprenol N-acetyl-beta-D-mannosaminyltransferase [Rhodovulum sulfidophilum]